MYLSIKSLIFVFFINLAVVPGMAQTTALVIHGGAGNIYKENIPDSLQRIYRAKLKEALNTGYGVLNNGGTALETVQAVINILEDSPLFNAGKGAVFTHEGTNEMDASVMDGKTLNCGAVAGVRHIKNPINAAIEVMLHSPHVFMAGDGAEQFAESRGIKMEDAHYFFTEKRYNQLQRARQKTEGSLLSPKTYYKFGTVGAVALDQNGNIAAGTSTGGMTNKMYGRIGDSPVIGAGTYADNKTCGISATGHGEYFIRAVVAHDISALMSYKNMGIQAAADEVIQKKLVEMGGEGGVIGLDAKGNIMMSFNSNGMFRGYIKKEGQPKVYIFKNEK